MKKRLLTLFLTAMMLLSMLPAAALAEDVTEPDTAAVCEDAAQYDMSDVPAQYEEPDDAAEYEVSEDASQYEESDDAAEYEDYEESDDAALYEEGCGGAAAEQTAAASYIATPSNAAVTAFQNFLKKSSNYAQSGYTAYGYSYLTLGNYGGVISDDFLVVFYTWNNTASYNDRRAVIYGYDTSSGEVIRWDGNQTIGTAYDLFYSPSKQCLVAFTCMSTGFENGEYAYWGATAQNCCIKKYALKKTIEDISIPTFSYSWKDQSSGKTTSLSSASFNSYLNELVPITVLDLSSSSRFVDVQNSSEYYYTPVLWAVNQGITNGTDSIHFSPNATCNRAQVVTFLWRAAGSPTVGGSNPFSDVKKSDYFYQAVLWALKKGITNGTDSTHFSPNAKCTRGQVVTFMYRAANSPAVSGSNPYSDVKKSDYFYQAVLWAVSKGITKGTDSTHFSPYAICTRGQVVTFLYRS